MAALSAAAYYRALLVAKAFGNRIAAVGAVRPHSAEGEQRRRADVMALVRYNHSLGKQATVFFFDAD